MIGPSVPQSFEASSEKIIMFPKKSDHLLLTPDDLMWCEDPYDKLYGHVEHEPHHPEDYNSGNYITSAVHTNLL